MNLVLVQVCSCVVILSHNRIVCCYITEPCVRKTALIVCCMLHPDHCESSMTDSNMSETVLYNRGTVFFIVILIRYNFW